MPPRSLLRWAPWLGLVLGLVLSLLAASAAGHEGPAALGEAHVSGPVVRNGVLRHASELLAPRAQAVLVAPTPLLERAPAVPAAQFHLAATRGRYDFPVESLKSLDRAHVAVIRWRRHVPRMDSGDPPSLGPLAS